MTIEEIDAEFKKYRPLYGKIGNYLATLKRERDKISNDTTVADAKTELESEIVKLEPIEK